MISYSSDKSVASIRIIWKCPVKDIDLISFVKQSKGQLDMFQIYGDSIEYGKKALLYIGSVEQTQIMWKRLQSDHENISNLSFISGSICMDTWGCDPGEVEISLCILQCAIKPPINLISIETITQMALEIPYYITNLFDRGDLPEEVSSHNC